LDVSAFRDLQEARTKGRLLEAAAEMGDARWYPALKHLQETGEADESGWLAEALEHTQSNL
jgi:hypothetical protein